MDVSVYTEEGEFVCRHERQYGAGPTDATNPASQLPLLTMKLGAWKNSEVRDAIPDDLRRYLDDLDRRELGSSLKIMRGQVEQHGWEATIEAMGIALRSTGRLDGASVSVAAARAEGGSIAYDEPVDLGVYDAAMRRAM